ncbi:hypothetical protein GYB22_03945 [bacterium]|nr:hypothetical protein [bacterium]
MFTQLIAEAVTGPPVLLRACFNVSDSIVTLQWTQVNDACNSFERIDIYEKQSPGPFTKIASVTDPSARSYSLNTKDLNKTRSYYLSIHTLCDMLDSAHSDTILIDNERPELTVLDSLSYDFLSQDIIAGWKQNGSPDAAGYRIFKQVSGINDSIGQTQDTFYTISKNPASVFDVTIAAFDSCGLFSDISDVHRVCRLNSSIDTCLREISLNWSRYKGWAGIDSQVVLLNKNHEGYKRFTSFDETENSLKFTDFMLGDTLCFMVRSYSNTPGITSTSNIRCIETRAFYEPSYLYLSRVTVIGDEDISLEWESDDLRDIKTYQILRADNSGVPSTYNSVPGTQSQNYTYTDVATNVHDQFYSYKIESYNYCDELVLESNTSNSIFLEIDPGLSHNPYLNWDGGVEQYILHHQGQGSSTWNTIDVSSNEIFYQTLDTGGCFYIEAVENQNSYGYNKNSISNIECIIPDLNVYVPNSMNLGSENNRFIVLGTGIDHSKSRYQVFNRWGEMLVDNNTNVPWYGDYRGERVMQGIYVYTITVYGLKGEKQTYKGVLRVIDSN